MLRLWLFSVSIKSITALIIIISIITIIIIIIKTNTFTGTTITIIITIAIIKPCPDAPRPLGKPQYLRVWHDNSGEGRYSSWHLAFVSVRDLQTDEKTTFIANRWLAIDRDDGQVRG